MVSEADSREARQGVGKVDGRLSDLRGIWRVGAGAARPGR